TQGSAMSSNIASPAQSENEAWPVHKRVTPARQRATSEGDWAMDCAGEDVAAMDGSITGEVEGDGRSQWQCDDPIVIPAKAGIHEVRKTSAARWIPAFAGMTGGLSGRITTNLYYYPCAL